MVDQRIRRIRAIGPDEVARALRCQFDALWCAELREQFIRLRQIAAFGGNVCSRLLQPRGRPYILECCPQCYVGALQIARFEPDINLFTVQIGLPWQACQRPIKGRRRILAFLAPQARQCSVPVDPKRILTDQRFKVGNGAARIAFGKLGGSTALMHRSICRSESHRLFE
ncbi:MAG: hypothetical protein ABS88_21900 [Sphingopyxis sp. SCN 67-31]|nr:MAG: hypothetical protein ABS88_21900 [Sphingopyxis sp. SCN 67-31]